MGHYAFLNENNIVIEVITGRNENEVVGEISDWEEHYGNLRGKVCKRTSYNTIAGEHKNGGVPFRKNYAGIGYFYDEEKDAFIPPKPTGSWWILDELKCIWVYPIDYPEDGEYYIWNEEINNWELGPIEAQ
jgi:hypothetical protein